jgi:hypothetical protein
MGAGVGVGVAETSVVGGVWGVKVAVTGIKAVGVRVMSAPGGVEVGSAAGVNGTQAAANTIVAVYSNCKKTLLFILNSS